MRNSGLCHWVKQTIPMSMSYKPINMVPETSTLNKKVTDVLGEQSTQIENVIQYSSYHRGREKYRSFSSV